MDAEARSAYADPGQADEEAVAWARSMVGAYPLYVVDMDQNIVYWDAHAERDLGVPAQDALRRRCFEVLGSLDPRNRRICRQDCPVITMAREGRAASDFLVRGQAEDGKESALRVSILLHPGPTDDVSAVAHIVRQDVGGHRPAASAPSAPPQPPDADATPLTPRQLETLQLLAAGHSPADIARAMAISRVTVRNHIRAAMDRLDAHTRIEAIVHAGRAGLLTGPTASTPTESKLGDTTHNLGTTTR